MKEQMAAQDKAIEESGIEAKGDQPGKESILALADDVERGSKIL